MAPRTIGCVAASVAMALLVSTLLPGPSQAGGLSSDPTRRYNTSSRVVPDKLNVHIVAHTHDDVGWLKTVDQYYYGANSSIQHAAVQYIIHSVTEALQVNPDRKFIYVEQAFFQRWWREQPADVQATVKTLVKNGQLEFVNGGWCMHDEAATHYVAMVDQTSLGHRLLVEEFDGYTPTIGWQIDPFGHSATQAALLSAEAGFDGLFFARIDEQDKQKRKQDRTLEMVWRASESLGAAAQVFTGAFYGGYGPPSNFCWDVYCNDDPIMDDARLEDDNVQDRVNLFVNETLTQAQAAATNNIMLTMGSDFQHEYSHEWFQNLDKLIHYTNLDGRVNVLYSTPSQYVAAVHAANHTWTVKTDDFFPYSDNPHGYWTGYFTSRPALKRYVRQQSAYLQSARLFEVLNGGNGSETFDFEQALGVAQHHDAVSGTSKQHVAFDYAKRISEGEALAQQTINAGISALVKGDSVQFEQCPLMNVSLCSATTGPGTTVAVVHSSLSRSRMAYLRVPVSSSSVEVRNATGGLIPSQVMASPKSVAPGSAEYTVAFQVSVPAMGFNTYFITAATPAVVATDSVADATATAARRQAEEAAPSSSPSLRGNAGLSIDNGLTRVDFDATGRISAITDSVSKLTTAATNEFVWYNSSASGNGWGGSSKDSQNQNSGAYIFRPNGTAPYRVNTGSVEAKMTQNGPVVWEVTQTWADWLTVTIRLNAGDAHIEQEWTVGPVDISDGFGHEVVSKWTTDIASNQEFYTDSNGREMQKRKINYRPTWTLNVTEPIAGNYYPINAVAFIKDATRQFTIITDRSEGGGSIASGELEVMVHRRILFDDHRGVGEPLNETTACTAYPNFKRLGTGLVIRGTHRVLLTPPASAASVFRPMMDEVFSEPVVAFSNLGTQDPTPWTSWSSNHVTSWSAMNVELPPNVFLMTVQARPNNEVLLRFAHQFAVGEDAKLSQPVTFALDDVFEALQITSAQEMSLTANQPLADVHRLKWNTVDGVEQPQRSPAMAPGAMNVTLAPLSFATFIATVSP